jgi:L-fucose mutarotase
MLRYTLLHPAILAALASAGHGAKVLIADGNYPLATRSNPAAERVFLNLAPGVLTVAEVLRVLADAIPIEAAQGMMPDEGPEPPVLREYREILPTGLGLQTVGRFEFYEAARQSDTALAIATGDQRLYANLLLTIGVVPPESA